jgi:predicted tellurium resistance membrane protein TerC
VTALAEPEFWARLASIILIDLTLAGDNALVIALAVRTLPRRQQFYGRLWGTAGAVILRLAFIVVATWLLTIPLLQLVGGALLVWIALRLVRQHGESDGHLLAWLMTRFTWIIWLGGGVLGYVAGEMILNDQAVERWLGPLPGWLEAGPVILALVIAGVGRRATHNGRKHVAESA